jgi:hypothetical protein
MPTIVFIVGVFQFVISGLLWDMSTDGSVRLVERRGARWAAAAFFAAGLVIVFVSQKGV